DTAAVLGALHIDGGIADEPNILSGHDAALGEGQMDRFAGRFVGGRVARADAAPKEAGPTEPFDLAAEQRAGLVADDAEINPGFDERAQHRLAARQRRQPVEVDRAETIKVNLARLLPALSEMHWKTLAQTEPYPLPGFSHRPFGLIHRAHQEIERVVDRRPAVHQRVVPVEQDG